MEGCAWGEIWLTVSSEGHGPKLGLTVREQEGLFLLGGHGSFALFLQPRREQQTAVELLGAQKELAVIGTLLMETITCSWGGSVYRSNHGPQRGSFGLAKKFIQVSIRSYKHLNKFLGQHNTITRQHFIGTNP